MSWASLDRTREEYEKKVQEDEALLATVISRLLRNKKILKQANERAKAKAMCLASEMIESGELDMAEDIVDCPVRTIGMSLSPTVLVAPRCSPVSHNLFDFPFGFSISLVVKVLLDWGPRVGWFQ
ncbi:hypothetical protein BU25DRAFT_420377 [Macroventuria anomochaeta]|uniref:Uncharacterized protein n=1 Tax=Macroventuria anomochaeta TaxID=301207 RepID=A0ACB6S4H3_9PLEO|nr:uncharacterized protein BU25DRAFT_420377 [Macroventuria anomochaeta]KAF2628938.1 hypothetical protein BU25DRAFT_420377 [Macroventuria anomochaeta]